MKRVTITLSEHAALWAQRRAAGESISVSKLVGRIIDKQMRLSDGYGLGLSEWQKLKPVAGASGCARMTREETHERG
ncbi:MAG: hypothetical protein IH602_13485 [Bryobacteraceae bacterium]|nr:hypothetical protein [Bryobacteraceae bacterium]